MSGRRLKLKTKSDFVVRLSQAPILAAIEELIWNAFDESARTVELTLTRNDREGIDQIQIRDDGTSLSHANAPAAFENLGNSKKTKRTLESGVRLHGQKGEGRHKSLSLGNKVVWRFTYPRGNKNFSYEIHGTARREDPFFLEDESEAHPNERVGCVLTISNIERSLYQLTQPDARQELTAVFAPFLLAHSDRVLKFDGKIIRPRDAIDDIKRIRRFPVEYEENQFDVEIEVIHWKNCQTRRDVHLCSSNGIPHHQLIARSFGTKGDHSVFVKSALFAQLHEQNLLSSIELTSDEGLRKVRQKIWSKIRGYFRKRNQAQSLAAIERLQDEGSYPYHGTPKSAIDNVERKVFDLCAVNINRHLPNFSEGMDADGRKLLLRVVKEAISQNPTSVGKIIREVCKLPDKDAQTFAKLLEDVPLSNVVHLSSMVSSRLQFLKLFEAVVYLNPFDRVIKERTELQKLLSDNTWIFGEEYALGTDDENLKSVLETHVKILGRDHLVPEVRDADIRGWLTEFNKTQMKTPESLNRVPDLMLWKCFQERRADEYEFLVIEIKRPGVPIGRVEIAQIEDYSKAIMRTPFPDTRRTRWVFVVISDELDEDAEIRANQKGMPTYVISQQDRYEIRAMPWSHVIRSANARHDHLNKWLDQRISRERMLALAEQTYSEFLPPPKDLRKTVRSKAKRA